MCSSFLRSTYTHTFLSLIFPHSLETNFGCASRTYDEPSQPLSLSLSPIYGYLAAHWAEDETGHSPNSSRSRLNCFPENRKRKRLSKYKSLRVKVGEWSSVYPSFSLSLFPFDDNRGFPPLLPPSLGKTLWGRATKDLGCNLEKFPDCLSSSSSKSFPSSFILEVQISFLFPNFWKEIEKENSPTTLRWKK